MCVSIRFGSVLVCTPPIKTIGSYALDVAADVGSVRCVSISAWMCVEVFSSFVGSDEMRPKKKKSPPGGEVDAEWNVFSFLLSRIPYYCVITQYSFIKINDGDRSGMFLAVCFHRFLITMLLHSRV